MNICDKILVERGLNIHKSQIRNSLFHITIPFADRTNGERIRIEIHHLKFSRSLIEIGYVEYIL
jgi:hypothetical protein